MAACVLAPVAGLATVAPTARALRVKRSVALRHTRRMDTISFAAED